MAGSLVFPYGVTGVPLQGVNSDPVLVVDWVPKVSHQR